MFAIIAPCSKHSTCPEQANSKPKTLPKRIPGPVPGRRVRNLSNKTVARHHRALLLAPHMAPSKPTANQQPSQNVAQGFYPGGIYECTKAAQ